MWALIAKIPFPGVLVPFVHFETLGRGRHILAFVARHLFLAVLVVQMGLEVAFPCGHVAAQRAGVPQPLVLRLVVVGQIPLLAGFIVAQLALVVDHAVFALLVPFQMVEAPAHKLAVGTSELAVDVRLENVRLEGVQIVRHVGTVFTAHGPVGVVFCHVTR